MTLNIALMIHGNEEWVPGGPTIRVQLLANAFRGAGHNAEVCFGSRPPIKRFDIVHVFNVWPFETCLQALATARRLGARVVFSPIALDLGFLPFYKDLLGAILNVRSPETVDRELHELCDQTRPDVRPPDIRPPGASRAEVAAPVEGVPGHFELLRNSTAVADQVICLSHFERDYLASVGADMRGCTIVENSSDDFDFDDAAAQFRQAYGLDRYVLSVGRLEYRKNQAIAAHAMRGLKTPLVLIGDYGDPGYSELVRKYSDQNVFYIGPISDRKLLASAYAGADALLLPSWSEGAPLAALEAGFIGTPLVLSTMSSEQEYFGRHAQYVHPADVRGIRATVEAILKSPETAEQRKARSAALKRQYSFDRHCNLTLAAYATALGQAPRQQDNGIALDVTAYLRRMQNGFDPADNMPFDIQALCSIQQKTCAQAFAQFGQPSGLSEIHLERLARKTSNGSEPEQHQLQRRSVETFDRRRTARIARGAAPGHKDYGLWRRVPKRSLGNRRPSVVMVPVAYTIGAIGRWLHVRRRHSEILRFRATSVGETIITQVPARSKAVPLNIRLLVVGNEWLTNVEFLDELVWLARNKAVRLEPCIHEPSTITARSGTTDRVDPLQKLLQHSSVVYALTEEVAAMLQDLRTKLRLHFEIVSCAAGVDSFIAGLGAGPTGIAPRNIS